MSRTRLLATAAAATALVLTATAPAAAHPGAGRPGPVETIPLPDRSSPEGIAGGPGQTFYAGIRALPGGDRLVVDQGALQRVDPADRGGHPAGADRG